MTDLERGAARTAKAAKAAKPRSPSLFAKQYPEPVWPKSLRCCLPQIMACLACGLFNFPEGLSLSYSSSLIPELQRPDSPIPITLNQGVLLASSMVGCMAVGTLLAGVVMNRFGRVNTIRYCTLPFAAGWFLVATASTYEQVLAGRILTGLANPLGVNAAVVFSTEVAPAHLRGALNGAHPTMASLGIVGGYVLGAITDWRTAAWWSGASPIVVLVLMHVTCYESPIWLVSKGRVEEAARSLHAYARRNDTEEGRERLPERQLEWLVQRRVCSESYTVEMPWYQAILNLFTQPVGYKPLLLLTVIFLAQNFSGVYITLFYAAPFFKEMGVQVDPFQAAILVGLTRLFTGVLAVVLIRKVGNRRLMTTASLGMAVCMMLSGYFTLYPENGLDGWVAVGLVLLYVSMSCCGLLTLPWTMTAELFPDRLRDVGQSFAVFTANLIEFAALQLYPTLMNGLQYGPVTGPVGIQWFFAAVALANVVFAIFFLPETRGKSLQEIEEHYQFNTLWLGRVKAPLEEPVAEAGADVFVISTTTVTDVDARKSSSESVVDVSQGDSYKL
ncbi:facilitated trehalose transporter Tret1-like [Thrips palmi]|uniref:Facilitated trehalose transporter Tret1-like n=1 Tax=Thrips palmi TaxID=161013 RepID=A0A6P8ZTP7_THRPL|nr:facilitated trehalose transporter Tret1-like [Thrips palmi]